MKTSWLGRREGPVAVVTLARPPINALDGAALEQLDQVVRNVEADPGARVLVLASGLEGVFCSGGDLRFWRDVRDAGAVSRAGRDAFTRLERLSKPTVAAINGQVIGDGLALALACDLRIASEDMSVRLPEAHYGFIPGWGLLHRLLALVGRARATELLLTGRKLEAPHALTMGLVTRIVPPARLLEEALALAQEMAAHSPAALRAGKCALLGGDEVRCFESVWGKADWHEGIDALLGRRPPVFGSIPKGDDGHDLAG